MHKLTDADIGELTAYFARPLHQSHRSPPFTSRDKFHPWPADELEILFQPSDWTAFISTGALMMLNEYAKECSWKYCRDEDL